ncbi:MAG: hypothetical protein COW63_12865 [Bacteroidetes bacterium CG18_big_fil_WC_8_21_14_2_50_41_14]|nr:MAG: hypothetical protein COW63_12865 [Bacteroidetes bacterium CG18_big_fil_WC_8_21_14_2_50_41_14]PJB55694.1 MAG: hypothetical protein CO098_15825 [Bacteroidetes bacterium CG_4_9_14_3_um_filter_41_19]
MKRTITLTIAFITLVLMNACYYDSEEALYPQNSLCDTTNVSYSTTVFPILSAQCVGCHSGFVANGNVQLDSYEHIVSAVSNGSLLGAIRHESGWSPMPQNTGQLDDCTIRKLEIWVANGTPNN